MQLRPINNHSFLISVPHLLRLFWTTCTTFTESRVETAFPENIASSLCLYNSVHAPYKVTGIFSTCIFSSLHAMQCISVKMWWRRYTLPEKHKHEKQDTLDWFINHKLSIKLHSAV